MGARQEEAWGWAALSSFSVCGYVSIARAFFKKEVHSIS